MFQRSRAPEPRQKDTGRPSWTWRRAVVIPVICYACYRMTMLEAAADTRVNEDLVWWWGVIITFSLAFLTGFATAQDIVAMLAARTGLPYQEQPQYYQRTETMAPVDPGQPAMTTTTTTTQAPVAQDEPVLDGPGPGARL